MQHRRKQKVVVTSDDRDLKIATLVQDALKFQSRVDSAETTSKYEDPARPGGARLFVPKISASSGFMLCLLQDIHTQ
jgi:hypothetical protein